MTNDRELLAWGRQARTAFRGVFSPLLGACLLLNVRARAGVLVENVFSGPFALIVITTIVVGFVVSGALWLAAEVRTGYQN